MGYSLAERMRRLLCDELWTIGIIDQPIDDIARNGITAPVQWLPRPAAWQMLADPACRLHPGGGCTLYAEQLDYRGRRIGEIWQAEIEPGGDLAAARFAPFLVSAYHMSYPFPLEDEPDGRLLTAETWNAECAQLWQLDETVTFAGTVMPGRKVVDPTLWRNDDGWWLFCSFQDSDPDGALFLHHAPDLRGPWTPHPRNPVQHGRHRSRPAGPLFRMGDALIRPAQDCSATYGGAVLLHQVTRLDARGYEERPLRRLDPVPGPYGAGLHTICGAGKQTLVDGKRWQTSMGGLAYKIMRSLRKRVSPAIARHLGPEHRDDRIDKGTIMPDTEPGCLDHVHGPVLPGKSRYQTASRGPE